MPLQLSIPENNRLWNPEKEEFIFCKAQTLTLEHSLVSISKWESKWHKSFLENIKNITNEELMDYIKCMTMAPRASDDAYLVICHTPSLLKQVIDYIGDPMTATVIYSDSNSPKGRSRDKITSELIYFLMINYNIPVEFQKWHLNRLLTLIRVCEIKTSTNNKAVSPQSIISRNRALNNARRKRLGTRG